MMKASTFAGAAIGCFAIIFLSAPAQARQMEDMDVVVLRTIDKLSARSTTFEVPVDKTVKFGSSLYIKPRACRKASALDLPENAAFLQIWEHKPHEDKPDWVFSGWMFSSSPGASAMEHPVYDVWVMDCKNAATAARAQPFSSEAAPATPPPATGAVTSPTGDVMTPPVSKDASPPATDTPAPVAAPKPEDAPKPPTPAALPDVQPSFEDEGASPNRGD